MVKLFNLSLFLDKYIGLNNFYIADDNTATIFSQDGTIVFFDLNHQQVIKKINLEEQIPDGKSYPFYQTFSLFKDYLLITGKRGIVSINLKKQNIEYPAELISFPKFIYKQPNSAIFCTTDVIYIVTDVNVFQLDLKKHLYYHLKTWSKGTWVNVFEKCFFNLF